MFLDRRRFVAALGLAAGTALASRRVRALAASTPDLAQDPNRPELHFVAPHNWMNDPNGPIWWKGKYHLFYQMNPGAAVWGDMHWGHAVSTDMVHWRHQPIALAPTPGWHDGDGCFSGSAVVHNGVPTLIYTGIQAAPPELVTIHDSGAKYRETQLLATAVDDTLGSWKKLPDPVVALPPAGMAVTGFRDPCPWQEGDAWYMVVGSGERGKGGCALLYRSTDLRHWDYLHPLASGKPNGLHSDDPNQTGEMWECPDFFEVNGQHCLLYSAEGKVFWNTGDYDIQQHTFTVKRQGLLDRGAFYAPKSFRAPDGRRILWGWIQERRPEAEFAAAGWSGAMSLPRVLTIGAQGQLEIAVAAEAARLRGPEEKIAVQPSAPFRRKLATLRQELRLPVEFPGGKVTVGLSVNGARLWELTVDVPGNAIRCGGTTFPLPALPYPRPALHIFLDGSVIESFIGGREALTSRVYGLKPGETELEVAVSGQRGSVFHLWPLAAISPDRLTT